MSSSDNVPDHIWNKTFISIFIANMLMFLGQQMINTLVAKYANHLGAAPAIVGFVTSGFAYSALLLKLVSAPAIDTFNKKYILTGAMLVMAAAFVGCSLSYSIPTLLMCRLLQGAGQAFSATCCLALASNALPPDKLGTGIGYYSLAQVICQSIGPTIGLYLVRLIGYNLTFAVGAGSSTNYIGQDLGNLVGPTIAGTVAGHFSYSVMWRYMTIPICLSIVIVCVFRRKILNAGQQLKSTTLP